MSEDWLFIQTSHSPNPSFAWREHCRFFHTYNPDSNNFNKTWDITHFETRKNIYKIICWWISKKVMLLFGTSKRIQKVFQIFHLVTDSLYSIEISIPIFQMRLLPKVTLWLKNLPEITKNVMESDWKYVLLDPEDWVFSSIKPNISVVFNSIFCYYFRNIFIKDSHSLHVLQTYFLVYREIA